MKWRLFFLGFFLIFSSPVAANPVGTESISPIPLPDREYANNLDNLAKREGLIGEFFKLKLAEKYLGQNHPELVQKTISQVSAPIFKMWKNLLNAETLLSLGKSQEALNSLPKLPSIPRPELSFGETFYKNICTRVLWVKYHAKTALGKSVKKELSWLSVLLSKDTAFNTFMKGKTIPPFTLEQKLTKLHMLYFGYQFKNIPGVVSKDEILATEMPIETRCRALYELGDGLRLSPGYSAQALETFAALTRQPCPEDYAAKGLYRHGSLALSLKNAGAENSLLKLFEKYPQHRLADDSFYLLLKHHQKTNNTSAINKYAEKLLSLPTGDMREEYLFEIAYPLYKSRQYKKASQIFGKVTSARASHGESYPRNLYWYARSLEKFGGAKNQAKAKMVFHDIVSKFPFSFYAVLTANHIKTRVEVPAMPTLTGAPPAEDVEYFDTVHILNTNGFHTAASAMLDVALHTHPEWEKTNKEYVTHMLIESQNYRKALELAAIHFDSGVYGPTQITDDPMFAAFYPQAYQHQTDRGYATSGLPRGAIEGIMREESLFQKNVRSFVGATGLMQLMPATAKLVMRKLPNQNILNDLTDPQSNIMLGSTYLQSMVDYFNDQLPLAVMAYNAGPGNVNKWLRNRSDSELDEFIEDIPFTETRGYVKRVLRSMQVYGAMYKEVYFRKPFLNFSPNLAKK